MNEIYIILGITLLITNVVVVINIVKAGKYSKLTYKLIEEHLRKINALEIEKEQKELKERTKGKDIKDIWKEIQDENN